VFIRCGAESGDELRTIIGASLALALAAGAALAEDKPAEPTGPPPEANLIIYRTWRAPIYPASIRVDGAQRATLGNHSYTALTVPPGKHSVKLIWKVSLLTGGRNEGVDVTVEPGKTTYVQIEGYVDEVPADFAQKALGNCCKYRPPSGDPAAP
jgi:hypothetical protein